MEIIRVLLLPIILRIPLATRQLWARFLIDPHWIILPSEVNRKIMQEEILFREYYQKHIESLSRTYLAEEIQRAKDFVQDTRAVCMWFSGIFWVILYSYFDAELIYCILSYALMIGFIISFMRNKPK